MIDETLTRKAKEEMARRINSERGRYYTPNGGLERFMAKLDAEIDLRDGKTHVCILRVGNRGGKTAWAANLAAYLNGQYPNEYFDKFKLFRDFRKPNRGRIMTTATAAQVTYDEELAKWMPAGAYSKAKNGHKFNQYYRSLANGSEFDMLTFDQDPMQGESVTLDWAIADEPMPWRHYLALKSRFAFGGLIFMVFTGLEGSGAYKHQLEVAERLGIDIHVMEMSSEENCKTHGIRGVIPHAALASMWADFDEAELMARRDGKYLASSGVIFPAYRDAPWIDARGEIVGHVIDELSGYHRECFDAGLFTLACVCDPHDRKPFALSWDVTFPNQDNIVIAEWPDETLRPFHKIKSCQYNVKLYAKLIRATEMAIAGRPADIRLIDPNFGNAIKATSKNTVIEEFIVAGREINWPMDFDGTVQDGIDEGHIALKSQIGDPSRGQRPKLFVLSQCKNTRFALSNYAYKENSDDSRGLSERPELMFKDFVDLRRYRVMAGIRYQKTYDPLDPEVLAEEARRRKLFNPKRVASIGYVGMA